jgi:hypothetical protein
MVVLASRRRLGVVRLGSVCLAGAAIFLAPGEASAQRAAAPDAAPKRLVFQRRSTALLATGISLASVGVSVLGIGVGLYANAQGDCEGLRSGRPPPPGSGRLFCTDDRSDFAVAMGTMTAGGALFGIGLPMAVFGGADAATEAAPARGAAVQPVLYAHGSGGGVRFAF